MYFKLSNSNNVNLKMINDIKKIHDKVGLSDHSIPKDSHKVLLYFIMGVKFIEKHFTIKKKEMITIYSIMIKKIFKILMRQKF